MGLQLTRNWPEIYLKFWDIFVVWKGITGINAPARNRVWPHETIAISIPIISSRKFYWVSLSADLRGLWFLVNSASACYMYTVSICVKFCGLKFSWFNLTISKFVGPGLLVVSYLTLFSFNGRASIVSVGPGMMYTLH